MAICTIKGPVASMDLVGNNALYPRRTLPTRGHEDSEHLGYSAHYTSNHLHASVNLNNPDNPNDPAPPVLSLAALQALNPTCLLEPVC
jgi:hypothetical protein